MDELAGWDNTYERIGRKRGTVFYRLEIRTDDEHTGVHHVPLSIGAREDLDKDLLEETLTEWAKAHDAAVASWRVVEAMTCAVGGVGDQPEIASAVGDDADTDRPYPGPEPANQRNTFDDLDIDVYEGETITYNPAGNPSVYGRKNATVVDVGPGPDGGQSLIVRTDDGVQKVLPEWVVSDSIS
jgi:hypothetical protein